MKVITATEFRNNQKRYFDKSKKEGVVYVMRGGEMFSLRPTSDIELYYSNPQVKTDLDQAEVELQRGEVYEMREDESLDQFMDRMREDGNV